MPRASILFASVLLLLISGCGDPTDGDGTTYWEIQMTLKAGGTARVGKDVVIECRYMVVYPQDSIRTWHPAGKLIFSSHDWLLVSGDTAWTDTLQTLEMGRHDVVVRPVRRDMLGIDARMEAPPEGSWEDILLGRAALDVVAR